MEGLSAEDFPQELADLIGLLHRGRGRGAGSSPRPGRGDMPAMWLLGSSGFSAQLAGLLGLPFSLRAPLQRGEHRCPRWRCTGRTSGPSAVLDQPYAMVAVGAICADTDERAQWLAGPARLSFLQLRTGPAGAAGQPRRRRRRYPYTEAERSSPAQRFARPGARLAGDGPRQLTELLERTGADELMLTTMVYDIDDRVRSFELIAEKVAGGLTRP